jgi:hypothetical protein
MQLRMVRELPRRKRRDEMKAQIATAEAAETLDAGQWVEDSAGKYWCLFQTHIMVHQLMWKASDSGMYVALDGVTYPLEIREIDEPEGYTCSHKRIQECGQCTRCGSVVGDTEKWSRMEFFGFGIDMKGSR